jgi:nicotinamidase/pyrazinamidase
MQENSNSTMGYKEHAVKDVENLKSHIRGATQIHGADQSVKKSAFVIVDIQNDFFSGGALPVPEAETLIEPLNAAIKNAEQSGHLIIFTQDWHPVNHSSFEENGGDWKPHCIQGTNGAAMHSRLYCPSGAKIVRFGEEPEKDGYSPFENPLMDQLIDTPEVGLVYVAGIALEYCIFATCKEFRERNMDVVVLDSLIRAASPDKADETWSKLDSLSIKRQPNLPEVPEEDKEVLGVVV